MGSVMLGRHRLLVVAAAGWVAAILLAVPVALADSTLPGEAAIVRAVQEAPGWLEPAARGARAITTTEAVLLAGAALAAILFAGRLRFAAAALAIGLVVLPIAQGGLKEVVDRPRPTEAQVDVRDGWTSPSFPSGHVMSGTLLFTYLAVSPAFRSRLSTRAAATIRGVAIAVIVLNALANVYMGVHWPTDVVAGLLLGGGLGLAVVWLEGMFQHRRPVASGEHR